MAWEIHFHPTVVSDLEAFSASTVHRVLKIFDSLKSDDGVLSGMSLRVEGSRDLRFVKSMDLRVIYEVRESEMSVVVLRVSRDSAGRGQNIEEKKTKTHLSGVGFVQTSL